MSVLSCSHVSSHQSSSKHISKEKNQAFSLLYSFLFFFLTHFFFLRTQAEISSLITFLCSHKGKITCAGRNMFFFRSVAKQRTYFTLKVIDKHREQEKDKKSHSHWKIFIESRMLIYCLLSFFCKLKPSTSRNFRQKIPFFYIFLIFKDIYSHS